MRNFAKGCTVHPESEGCVVLWALCTDMRVLHTLLGISILQISSLFVPFQYRTSITPEEPSPFLGKKHSFLHPKDAHVYAATAVAAERREHAQHQRFALANLRSSSVTLVKNIIPRPRRFIFSPNSSSITFAQYLPV